MQCDASTSKQQALPNHHRESAGSQHHPHHRESGSADERAPFDLENVLLLQQPILPPNPNFFCCFNRVHITTVAKLLSVLYAAFYGFLCFLCYKSDHAAATLIAAMVGVSVGFSTLYASFKWSKLCLIPFFLLQTMLVVYVLVCVVLLAYALINPSSSQVYQELSIPLDGLLHLSTKIWIVIITVLLLFLVVFFFYSALLFWYEYSFIAEVDRFLKSIRKSSSHASKDDNGNGKDNTRLNI
ncbi:hypothetical protein Ddc_03167 [Ditylenchus destructor]|nr:hypothetical protein Ddc_03167 [Ditylenchus destructor]